MGPRLETRTLAVVCALAMPPGCLHRIRFSQCVPQSQALEHIGSPQFPTGWAFLSRMLCLPIRRTPQYYSPPLQAGLTKGRGSQEARVSEEEGRRQVEETTIWNWC